MCKMFMCMSDSDSDGDSHSDSHYNMLNNSFTHIRLDGTHRTYNYNNIYISRVSILPEKIEKM
jgi:hypothetical protein